MLKKLSAMLSVAIVGGCCMIGLSMGSISAAAANTTNTETKTLASDSLTIGDVDFNGYVNALDAADVLAEAALLGTGEGGAFTDEQLCCADVNNDNLVDATDASVILAYSSYAGAGGTDDFSTYLENGTATGETTAPETESTTTESTTTTTETTTQPEPEGLTGNFVTLTEDEATMLAALVTLEAGAESYECQKAVASLVINRMLTSGSTLEGVIYAKNQFSVASRVASTTPFTSCVNAVEEVLTEGTTIPIYVTFFRASYYHTWGDQVAYCCIDNTYFSYSQALKNKYVSK
ncbi:MAG: cell wall hydrolase [Oscillospiraceae bacterium]|nr:cell wall hydrolase [Oscillospiraceae bacterium]